MKFVLIFSLLIGQCFNCSSQEWGTYTSPDKLFKIKSQGDPEVMRLDAMYGIDSTLIYTFKGATKNEVLNLTVQYFSNERLNPELNEEERFNILKQYSEITIGMIGKVTHSEKIFLSEFLGIFLEGKITQGTEPPYPPILIKAYIVENRIFQLMFANEKETKVGTDKNVYFDSFEIL